MNLKIIHLILKKNERIYFSLRVHFKIVYFSIKCVIQKMKKKMQVWVSYPSLGGILGMGFGCECMYVHHTKTLNNKKVLKKQQQKKLLRVDIF